MNRLMIMLVAIVVIILTSKIVMKLLRQQDLKNGLVLRESDYNIKNSLLSSHKQEKRIEKLKRQQFIEYAINDDMWKKSYVIILASSIISVVFGNISKIGIGGAILIVILATVVFFKRIIKVMLLMDLVAILPLLSLSIKNIPVVILIPAVGIFNYIVLYDYIAYRRTIHKLEEA